MKKRLISIVTMIAMLASMLSVGITVSAAPVSPITATANTNQSDGIVLTKSATPKVDGTVDITLEAYTTGTVTSHTTVTPTDIVLVLDVSGSMDTSSDTPNYIPVLGTLDEGYDGIFINIPDRYGMHGGTYFIPDGNGGYIELTSEGYDSEEVSYYSYSTNGGETTNYVYPLMDSTVGTISYEFDYPKVQFYQLDQTLMSNMKAAVSDFIDQTLAMNNGLAADAHKHRIALVKYADNSYFSGSGSITDINGAANAVIGNNLNSSNYNYTQLVQDFTIVDSVGAASLKESVNSLVSGGATAIDYGLQMAQATLNKRPDTEIDAHDEIVVLFTDGSPTHNSGYEEGVANTAISEALALKNAGTTMYSISVADDASSAAITSSTSDTNKFMHYVSSNYPSATDMEYTYGSATDATTGYYMTDDDGVDLSALFEEIVQQVGTPTISLDAETAVVDTVSQYFDLNYTNLTDPAHDGVTIETVEKLGPGENWGTPVSGGATVSFGAHGSKQVLVDGFNFDENYISDTPRNSNFYGKKLRITLNVKPNYDAIDKMSPRSEIVDTNLALDPAKVVSPKETEPVATTASPQVGLKKVSYWVKGGSYGSEFVSFANGYYDVYRLPNTSYTAIFEPTEVGHTFSKTARKEAGGSVDITSAFMMPNDNVIIEGVFTPIEYNISYKYVGTVPSGVSPTDPATYNETNVPYGTEKSVATALATPPAGYTFSGWSADNAAPDANSKFNMPAGNVEFAGSFKANGNTKFRIEHYLEDLSGSTYTLAEGYDDFGTTDTEATAVPNQYDGFEFDQTTTGDPAMQQAGVTVVANAVKGSILGDGTRVLKLYYMRKSYTVSYAYTGTPAPGATDISGYGNTYKYGEQVTVKNASTADGYDFHGWTSETISKTNGESFEMPAHNVVFNGHFVAKGDTLYKVEHYLQNLDGSYPDAAHETIDHKGQTGSHVTAIPKYYEGFVFDSDHGLNKQSGQIHGDGSLVLKLYYEREKHNVDYEYIGIVPDGANELLPAALTGVMYKATVNVAADPYLAGYKFDGWQSFGGTVQPDDSSFEMPNLDVQLRGQFIPLEVEYTVKHIAQDENSGSVYTTELATETFEAYTGASVTAVRKDFTGYTYNDIKSLEVNKKSGKVLGDGSLVLYLYYDRNPLYSVEYAFADYVPAGVTVPTEPDHIEGEEVTLKDPVGTYDGYTFSGWTSYGGAVQPDHTSFTMPARDVHLTGYFTPNPTSYKVEYYFENIIDTNFAIDDSKTKIVTEGVYVGDSIVVAAEAFEGFVFNTTLSIWEDVAEVDEVTLKLYYNRAKYKVTYGYYGARLAGAPDLTTAPEYAEKEFKYGTPVQAADEPTWTGIGSYDFLGWYSSQITPSDDGKFVMPAKDVHLVGNFVSEEASYKVEHYIQVSGEEYELHSTDEDDTMVGAVGSPVTATPKTISGYTYYPEHQYTLAEGVITSVDATTGEGMLVLRLFYTKKATSPGGGGGTTRYTLTYESNGGTEYDKERYNSGKVVELDKVPQKDGYIFDGWHLDKDLEDDAAEVKMTKNITVYANWIEDNGAAGNGHKTPDSLNGDDHFAYVIGYPDGTVRPNANITRAEVTSIFFRLLKEEVRAANLAEANSFGDIDSEEWYNTAISTMTKLGIVKGRFEGKFVPDANITRAEFATICARFDDSEYTVVDSFSDVSGHWAEADIHEAAAHGWIRGYEDNTFKPDQFITRAEAMTMINRVLNRVPENKDALLDDMIKWPDNNESDWHYLAVQEATNSHEFEKLNNIYEKWVKLTQGTDWKVYE